MITTMPGSSVVCASVHTHQQMAEQTPPAMLGSKSPWPQPPSTEGACRQLAEQLFHAGSEAEAIHGLQALQEAAAAQQQLLFLGVNMQDASGSTPLLLAATRGWAQFARMLLAAGAGLDASVHHTRNGCLHLAALNGHMALVKLLTVCCGEQCACSQLCHCGPTPFEYFL
jgi:hypothetical protein